MRISDKGFLSSSTPLRLFKMSTFFLEIPPLLMGRERGDSTKPYCKDARKWVPEIHKTSGLNSLIIPIYVSIIDQIRIWLHCTGFVRANDCIKECTFQFRWIIPSRILCDERRRVLSCILGKSRYIVCRTGFPVHGTIPLQVLFHNVDRWAIHHSLFCRHPHKPDGGDCQGPAESSDPVLKQSGLCDRPKYERSVQGMSDPPVHT